jgi:hypothetical protein
MPVSRWQSFEHRPERLLHRPGRIGRQRGAHRRDQVVHRQDLPHVVFGQHQGHGHSRRHACVTGGRTVFLDGRDPFRGGFRL